MEEDRIVLQIEEFITEQINPSLNRIKDLLYLLGEPQKKVKAVHVSGTNGKGSVCAMTASILKEEGYKVGLYTSPHLHRLNERFCMNGKLIDDDTLLSLIKEVKGAAKRLFEKPSYFEVTTAMAFLYFAEEKVDYAVIEVGIEGRWDATNLCIPKAIAITNIGLDHTEYFGETKEKIAKEATGIIKEKTPIVTAEQEMFHIIEEEARKKNAPIYKLGEDIKIKEEDALIVQFKEKQIEGLHLSLKGKFQNENAALAIALCLLVDEGIKTSSIQKGVANAYWPGRFQFIMDAPLVIIDGAHNVDAAIKLVDSLKAFEKEGRTIVVWGMLNDKDFKGFLRRLLLLKDPIFLCTSPKTKRACPSSSLFEYARTYAPSFLFKSIEEALNEAHRICSQKDMILICGSLYVVAEALRFYGINLYS